MHMHGYCTNVFTHRNLNAYILNTQINTDTQTVSQSFSGCLQLQSCCSSEPGPDGPTLYPAILLRPQHVCSLQTRRHLIHQLIGVLSVPVALWLLQFKTGKWMKVSEVAPQTDQTSSAF